jgi:predicted RNase H-like HicB family nuclease
MTYSVVFEQITDASFPSGYYYAHAPALDLITHGLGIAGARAAARDLITVWLEEKRENGETPPLEGETVYEN